MLHPIIHVHSLTYPNPGDHLVNCPPSRLLPPGFPVGAGTRGGRDALLASLGAMGAPTASVALASRRDGGKGGAELNSGSSLSTHTPIPCNRNGVVDRWWKPGYALISWAPPAVGPDSCLLNPSLPGLPHLPSTLQFSRGLALNADIRLAVSGSHSAVGGPQARGADS